MTVDRAAGSAGSERSVPRGPRISVVVPVYNGENTIEDCVRSLLALAYPREAFEILVVDNGSEDRTPEILARYAGRARVLHEPRRGRSAARNAGLRHALGEVVAFTDADCTVHADWLREITAPLADPGIGIVGGTIRAREPCNAIERFEERIYDHELAIEVWDPGYVITMSWASPAAVLREVGSFDETLARVEDVDLSYRIQQAGYRMVFARDAVVYHRNDRSLWGLFKKGFAHGYHAVKVQRRHEAYVASRRRAAGARPRRRAWDGATAGERFYWSVFRSGKRLGATVARGARDADPAVQQKDSQVSRAV